MIVIGLIFLGLLIALIVMAVSTVGRIGLIQGTAQADADEEAQVTFGGLFNSMKPYFWRVLGLNLLIGVGFFIIAIILVFIFIFASVLTLGLGLICLIPLICLLIPVFWLLTTFVEMANVAVVVEDLNVIDGLKRGWEVFKDNLANMVLMGLVLVLGGFVVGLIVALPLIMVMVPFIMGLVATAFGETEAFVGTGLVVTGLCCVAYFPVLLVLSGIIRAYISSAWTLTFLRLTKGFADDEPVEIFPDEPDEPEALPEIVEEPAPAAETIVTAKPETPANPDDLLPEDF